MIASQTGPMFAVRTAVQRGGAPPSMPVCLGVGMVPMAPPDSSKPVSKTPPQSAIAAGVGAAPSAQPMRGGPDAPASSGDEAWGEMEDASFLAHAVAHAATRREQAEAWAALWTRTGRAIAERVKGQFGRSVPENFADHAQGVIYEKLARGLYDWRQGAFANWCFTVLHRQAISLYHQGRGAATSLDALPYEPIGRGGRGGKAAQEEVGLEEQASEEMPGVSGLLKQLREELDALANRDELRSQVNYFAVLLLELRRGLVTRLKARGVIPGLAELMPQWGKLTDSAVVRELLPWRSGELSLKIKAPYPKLGEIWSALEASIDGEPHDLPVEVLRTRIVAGDGEMLTDDAWFNWKRHLRRRLAGLVDATVWNELFAPWF